MTTNDGIHPSKNGSGSPLRKLKTFKPAYTVDAASRSIQVSEDATTGLLLTSQNMDQRQSMEEEQKGRFAKNLKKGSKKQRAACLGLSDRAGVHKRTW